MRREIGQAVHSQINGENGITKTPLSKEIPTTPQAKMAELPKL